MKNINPSEDQHSKTPFLVSETSDFIRLSGEARLRTLALAIPSHGHHQLQSKTLECMSATIHATQEFLSQVVSGLALTNPALPQCVVVSSSGLNVEFWLKESSRTQNGWIPTYPVTGFITQGRLNASPEFGASPLEPAITLSVKRGGEPGFEDFLVEFSISDHEDMRILSLFLEECAELWDQFESIFAISLFTSIPLPDEVENQLIGDGSCRRHVKEFVKHIVSKDDGNMCLETICLQFSVGKDAALHEPVVASITLLCAFTLYQHSVATMDRDKSRAKALEGIQRAITIGQANSQSKKGFSGFM